MKDSFQTARSKYICAHLVAIQEKLEEMMDLYDIPIPAEVSAWVRELQDQHAEPTGRGGHE